MLQHFFHWLHVILLFVHSFLHFKKAIIMTTLCILYNLAYRLFLDANTLQLSLQQSYSGFLRIKIIDCNVKKSVTTSIRLQATSTFAFFSSCKRGPAYSTSDGSWISQNTPWVERNLLFKQIFPKNCKKMKKIWTGGFLSTLGLGCATKDQ